MCRGLGTGATITTMSKILECSLHLKRSLSNNPGCQTTSAELQDSHHKSDSKSGTQTHWAVLQGPEGGGLEVAEAVEQMGRVCWARGRNWTRDGSFQRHLQLCNCCQFSLPLPTNLTSQASPSPQALPTTLSYLPPPPLFIFPSTDFS